MWASKWNDRAWLGRQAAGLAEDDLFMACLLQQVLVVPEFHHMAGMPALLSMPLTTRGQQAAHCRHGPCSQLSLACKGDEAVSVPCTCCFQSCPAQQKTPDTLLSLLSSSAGAYAPKALSAGDCHGPCYKMQQSPTAAACPFAKRPCSTSELSIAHLALIIATSFT